MDNTKEDDLAQTIMDQQLVELIQLNLDNGEKNAKLVFNKIPLLFEEFEQTNFYTVESLKVSTKANIRSELMNNFPSNYFDDENTTDFSGMYVFYHDDIPFYVGISRKVLNRLNQHLKGKSHFNATLAHKLCRKLFPNEINTRSEFHNSKSKEISQVQDFLSKCKLKIFPVVDPNELYLLEVYTSLELGSTFNDFKTT
jgi:predicted GIY-YIG superfamily endonuclease